MLSATESNPATCLPAHHSACATTAARWATASGLASSLAVLLIAAVGWLYPLVSFAAEGLSLAGGHDEAVGYRYFYTLRRLYGDHEQPWVPHGQVQGIVHIGLHLALTAAGYPPTQLHPRLDIWTYLAPAVPLVLAVFALVWAVQPIQSMLGRIVIALTMLGVTYETAIYVEYHLTAPEYHPWIHLWAAIALGWLLRLIRELPPESGKTAILLGVYAAFVLGTKPSYLPFPVTIGLLLLLQQTSVRQALVLLVGSAVSMLAVLLVLTWAFYLGDVGMVAYHFQMLPFYVDGELSDTPFGSWISAVAVGGVQMLPVSLTDPRVWLVLLPILMLLSLRLRTRRAVSIALLVSSGMYLVAIDRRSSYATFVEVYDYLVMAGSVWLWGVVLPWVRDRIQPLSKESRRAPLAIFLVSQLCLAASVLYMVSWIRTGVAHFDMKTRPLFEVSTEGQRELDAFLAETRGRTLFAFADYPHRPITVDGAIHRGGLNLGQNWRWTSPFMQAMFPDRMYIIGDTGDSARQLTGRYRKLVFTYQPGNESEAMAVERLEQRLQVKLDGFTCPFWYPFWDTTQPQQTLSHVIIVRGCVRSGPQ